LQFRSISAILGLFADTGDGGSMTTVLLVELKSGMVD